MAAAEPALTQDIQSAGPPANTRWLRLALIFLAGVAAATHTGKVPPALPFLRPELEMSLVQAGWLIGLISVIGAFGGVAFGVFSDRFTHRNSMLLGLFCITVGSLLGASAQSGEMLLVTRAVEGFGVVLTAICGTPMIFRAVSPQDHRFAFGLWGCWYPTGITVLMLLAPWVIVDAGWRTGWLVASGISALCFVLLAWETRGMNRVQAQAAGARPSKAGFLEAVRAPGGWLLGGIFGFYAMTYLAVFGFLPTFLVEQLGTDPSSAILLTALAVFANSGGNLTSGWIARRASLIRWLTIFCGLAIMGLSGFLIYQTTFPAWARYLAAIIMSFSGGFVPSTIFGWIPSFAPKPALVGTISGIVVQCSMIGQVVGPPALAFAVGYFGWGVSPWFVVVSCLIPMSFALALGVLERRRKATAA
jgi:MFS family permease